MKETVAEAPPPEATDLPTRPLAEENERLARELENLEGRFRDALQDLKAFLGRWKAEHLARDRAMRRAWADLDHRWFNIALAGAAFFSILRFYAYSQIGRHHDQAPLPAGLDPVLDRLPLVNLVPVPTYG